MMRTPVNKPGHGIFGSLGGLKTLRASSPAVSTTAPQEGICAYAATATIEPPRMSMTAWIVSDTTTALSPPKTEMTAASSARVATATQREMSNSSTNTSAPA